MQPKTRFSNNENVDFHAKWIAFVHDVFYLPQLFKTKTSLHRLLYANGKCICFENLKPKNSWVDSPPLNGRLRRSAAKINIWSVISYWRLVKELIPNAVKRNWSIWNHLLSKNTGNLENAKLGNFITPQPSIDTINYNTFLLKIFSCLFSFFEGKDIKKYIWVKYI